MDMPVPAPSADQHGVHTEGRAASEVLQELSDSFTGERISVGELIDKLDSRAHGVLLLILALPMCIPNVPGISTIFGVLMIAPALGLLFGQRRLWLPRQVRAWTFPRAGFCRALSVAIRGLKRVEFLIKPRLSFLTRWPVTSAVGFQTLLMALVLILPIFGANMPPGIAVVMMALALMQRDGLLMLLSIPIAVGSIIYVYLFTKYGILVAAWLGNWAQDALSSLNIHFF